MTVVLYTEQWHCFLYCFIAILSLYHLMFIIHPYNDKTEIYTPESIHDLQ